MFLDKEVLVDICHDLDSDDLEKLKFLMKDVAGLSKLKSAGSALELFDAIENNKSVALHNGRFLAECFELMGRSDLVRQIGFLPSQIHTEMGTDSHSINPFRILLYGICEDLSTEDVAALTFYAQRVFTFTRKEKESVNSSFDIFILLEKRGNLSVGNTRSLKEMVQSLENRGDLVDMVTEYQAQYPDKSDETEGGNRIIADANTENIPGPPSSWKDRSLLRDRSVSAVPFYEMTTNPRGFCVIISNKKFMRMPPREGTDIDQARLEATFRKLGFIVHIYKDLTVKDMAGVMNDYAVMDHSKFSSFVVCILSHGGENFIYRNDNRHQSSRRRSPRGEDDHPIQGNFVYGSDDKPIPIRYLTMYFRSSKCKTLADKPKLFFIQACQGEDMETGILLSSDIQQDGPSIDDVIGVDVGLAVSSRVETDTSPYVGDSRKVIPDESDFLLGYATVFGYVSYRSRSQGSFYIKSLTENLDNHADTLDLQQIMVKVNHDVSEQNIQLGVGEAKKQVPMTQITLRKLLFFSPDNLGMPQL